jgi:hypothetical protein
MINFGKWYILGGKRKTGNTVWIYANSVAKAKEKDKQLGHDLKGTYVRSAYVQQISRKHKIWLAYLV